MFSTSTLTSCWTELESQVYWADRCVWLNRTVMLWHPLVSWVKNVFSSVIRIYQDLSIYFSVLSVVYSFLFPLLLLSFQLLPSLLASLFILFFLPLSILVFLHSTTFSAFSPSLFLSVHCFWRQGAAVVSLCNDCLPLNKFSQLVSCQLQTAIAAGVHREQQQTYIVKKKAFKNWF